MNNLMRLKEWLMNHYQLVLIAVIALFVIFKFLFIGADSEHSNIEEDTRKEITQEASQDKDVKSEMTKSTQDININKSVTVDVKGAVNFPNTYNMKSSDRVNDVLKKAQTKNDADLSQINLSEKLKDQMYIYVPVKGEKVLKHSTNQSSDNKVEVNINTGDKAEIEKLPGIGPSKAEAILQYRETKGEFKKIEDLKNVKGFGEKTIESLRDYIVLN
ncbi:helix-hairpin-helix domain-containing protein [Mammaliicoccus vitulinus]|uniref:Helix-hairpin-helix domain-containing protein n=1 Tax=Mammaliicoccus vitulinus TaxID=71237 RepID=A0ABX7HEP4_9STAP|nr:helix-hairpin-helix domain-containing protein [Mammaliicoccus vitulinus]PNZ36444.1 hypothetical protein CD107_09515 [Mammaliicoccus vitulinus]QRO84623.1 helix-hairpin-helix domain-containing protein [Mammaliicoccus vitulinus]QTN11884.1 hypothetical protein G7A42_08600 [Mammaliicoccus vitulinus]